MTDEPPSRTRRPLTNHSFKQFGTYVRSERWKHDARVGIATVLTCLLAAQAGSHVAKQAQAARLVTNERDRVEVVLTNYLDLATLTPAVSKQSLATVVARGAIGSGGPTPSVSAAPRTYTVQSGDTLSTIGEQFGYSSSVIVLSNQSILTDTEIIQPGQVLTIPDEEPSPEALAAEMQSRRQVLASKAVQAAETGYVSTAPISIGLQSPVNYSYKSRGFSYDHKADDLVAPLGTPVYAAAEGCISSAGFGWNGGYGTLIVQDIGNDTSIRYAHLSAIAKGIESGACVASGELLGYVGTTGNSTGPHLHFEVRIGGVPVDPNI